MTNTPFTVRNVSKFIVTSFIAHKVSNAAADAITDYTRFEEDDFAVDLGSKCIGWYVSGTVKPLTDKMVDKTADFVTTKREARQAKKTAKKED